MDDHTTGQTETVEGVETFETFETADIRVDFSIYYPILPTAISVMNILIGKGYMDPDAFIYAVRPEFSRLSRKKSDFFYS